MGLNLSTYDIIARALVIFTAMPIHEFAHGWVAYKLGDPTAKAQGRLNINPFTHLDIVGCLMIFLAGFGWAKPVPVNPYNFRKNPKGGMALTALAGPVSNILIALVVMILYKVSLISFYLTGNSVLDIISTVLRMMVLINISLAVFNLIPVVPLDGSRILSYFLPNRIVGWMEEHSQIIYFVFLGLVLFTNVLTGPIYFVSGLVVSALDFLTGWVGLLMNLFI